MTRSGKATPKLLRQAQTVKGFFAKHPELEQTYTYVRQANVVLHSQLNPGPRAQFLSRLVGRDSPTTTPCSPGLRLVSAPSTPGSTFAHFKIATTSGTLLVFKSMHIIRSGGSSHGGAIVSLLKFVNYLRRLHPTTHGYVWPSASSIPNSVYTGQFKRRVNASFRSSSAATYTSKFPGIAVTLPTTAKITPELFLKESKFILPGIKNEAALCSTLLALREIALPHLSN
jgi:hypothetical protein